MDKFTVEVRKMEHSDMWSASTTVPSKFNKQHTDFVISEEKSSVPEIIIAEGQTASIALEQMAASIRQEGY